MSNPLCHSDIAVQYIGTAITAGSLHVHGHQWHKPFYAATTPST